MKRLVASAMVLIAALAVGAGVTTPAFAANGSGGAYQIRDGFGYNVVWAGGGSSVGHGGVIAYGGNGFFGPVGYACAGGGSAHGTGGGGTCP